MGCNLRQPLFKKLLRGTLHLVLSRMSMLWHSSSGARAAFKDSIIGGNNLDNDPGQ